MDLLVKKHQSWTIQDGVEQIDEVGHKVGQEPEVPVRFVMVDVETNSERQIKEGCTKAVSV